MGANLRKIMQETPRPLVVAANDAKHAPPPLGRTPVGRTEMMRRIAPLMPHIAFGTIPLDETTADMVKFYLDHTKHDG